MATESRSVQTQARIARLRSSLTEARERARVYEFDQPGDRAIALAQVLFEHLAAVNRVPEFDVCVAVDGAIEVTGYTGSTNITIDVSPTGSRIDAVLDTKQRIIWVGEDISLAELLTEIERAA